MVNCAVYTEGFSLKGVFAKNERGYRLNTIKKALLIATNLTYIQIEKIGTHDLDRKKINLILNKSFRYYNL